MPESNLMQRACSVFTVKSYDEDERTITGIATTPSTDRMGDVVEPRGAKFALPIPLLWQHDHSAPVGMVESAEVTDAGIKVRARVVKIKEAGKLKDRADEAWQSVKAGLVRGFSIGFRPLDRESIKGGGLRFKSWDWLELSLVTVPANADASIQMVKAIDTKLRAASGDHAKRPGASGITTRGNIMHSINELREMRETKSARLGELATMLKSADYEPSDAESSEFDVIKSEIAALDRDIRVKEADEIIAGRAARVASHKSSGPTVFARNADPEDKFQGQSYTRLLIAKARSHLAMRDGEFVSPAQIAERLWGKSHPNLVRYIKAGVPGGGTESGEWGAELAQSDTRFMGDFISFLYKMTVFDRLPLRSIPARVHVKGQDGASTGFWVGESRGIPVTDASASDVELTPLKVAAIAVMSRELIEDSSPSAETMIRDSLAEALAQRVDTTFLGSAAASSGVSPAGILNGVTPFQASGTDAAAVRADFQSLALPFLQAYNGTGLVHVMRPEMAMAISMLVNALGQTEFPDIEEAGGTLFRRQVYTGDNVTAGNWIVLKPSDIWKIGDSGLRVSMSDTATIEQDTAPTGRSDTPADATANRVSMFQTESVAFKVVRRINYAKRRTGVVQYIENAEYGGVVS